MNDAEKVQAALTQEAYIRPLLEKCAERGIHIADADELQAALHIIDRANTLAAQQPSAGFLKEAAVRLDQELTARGILETPASPDVAARVLAALQA